mgnify:CR=1 FL=1
MVTLTAVFITMRPRQWVKNLLVVAAPLAAGKIFFPSVALNTAVAFVSFALMSSAVYCVNDVADAEADRAHPSKRFRPVASGALSAGQALIAAAVLAAASLALAATTRWALPTLLGIYFVLQVLYAYRLKHEPVIDLAVVTAGFLMRAVAGGLAAHLPISQWFLLVAGFGSLFMVSGKRYSELHTLGSEAGTRRSLVGYTATYLRFVWSAAAAVTLVSYSLWAFEQEGTSVFPWHTASIAAFTLGMLRYAVDIDLGAAASPEDIVYADRWLQVVGVIWLVLVALGVLNVG